MRIVTDDPSILNFKDHQADAAADTRVRCPRCSKRIFMHDTRCQHCGIHFEGEAWEFSPSTRENATTGAMGLPGWLIATVTLLVLIGFLLAIF